MSILKLVLVMMFTVMLLFILIRPGILLPGMLGPSMLRPSIPHHPWLISSFNGHEDSSAPSAPALEEFGSGGV
jgi:hypothetical protein